MLQHSSSHCMLSVENTSDMLIPRWFLLLFYTCYLGRSSREASGAGVKEESGRAGGGEAG